MNGGRRTMVVRAAESEARIRSTRRVAAPLSSNASARRGSVGEQSRQPTQAAVTSSFEVLSTSKYWPGKGRMRAYHTSPASPAGTAREAVTLSPKVLSSKEKAWPASHSLVRPSSRALPQPLLRGSSGAARIANAWLLRERARSGHVSDAGPAFRFEIFGEELTLMAHTVQRAQVLASIGDHQCPAELRLDEHRLLPDVTEQEAGRACSYGCSSPGAWWFRRRPPGYCPATCSSRARSASPFRAS